MAAAAEGRSFWKRRRGSGGKVRGGRGTGTLEAARDRGAAAEGGIGIEGEGRKEGEGFLFSIFGGFKGSDAGEEGLRPNHAIVMSCTRTPQLLPISHVHPSLACVAWTTVPYRRSAHSRHPLKNCALLTS
jgi:hypothetical protein